MRTLANGGGLDCAGDHEESERVTITLDVPLLFLEEFKARIEDLYLDLSEAVRSGIVLTLRLLYSPPSL